MSEAVEYRLASLKTFVAQAVLIVLLGVSGVFLALDAVLASLLVYSWALAMAVVVQGRRKNGYCRRFIHALPIDGYDDPPLDEWKDDLEHRGLFHGGKNA